MAQTLYMPQKLQLEMAKGESEAHLEATVLDDEGAPLNIAGATVVFRMSTYSDGTVKVNNATASNLQSAGISSTTGKVCYHFAATDTDTAGLYLGWFVVTLNDGTRKWPPEGAFILIRDLP